MSEYATTIVIQIVFGLALMSVVAYLAYEVSLTVSNKTIEKKDDSIFSLNGDVASLNSIINERSKKMQDLNAVNKDLCTEIISLRNEVDLLKKSKQECSHTVNDEADKLIKELQDEGFLRNMSTTYVEKTTTTKPPKKTKKAKKDVKPTKRKK